MKTLDLMYIMAYTGIEHRECRLSVVINMHRPSMQRTSKVRARVSSRDVDMSTVCKLESLRYLQHLYLLFS